MVYLVLGLFCSAAISVVLKIGDRKEYDRYGMLMFNYLTCVVTGFLFLPSRQLPENSSGWKFAIVLGVINGCLYLGSMAMNQVNVRRNGAILQSTFARLGVMIPTICSIVLFGERPSFVQALGILLVIAAIILMYIGNQGDSVDPGRKPAIALLMCCLLFGGASDFMSKIFEQYGVHDLDDWFVELTFLAALLLCVGIVAVRRIRVGIAEMILGIALGVPNLLSTRFLLKALSTVPAYMAYPMYSVGAIFVVLLISSIFFGEKLSKWSRCSLLLIVSAIVMLNLS